MKILFLSHRFYPDIGGIEVNSEILAKEFTDAGHDVRLMTWTESTGAKEFPFAVARKPSLARMFQEHRWADLVFENNPCLRLAWPGLILGKRSVVALRTWVSRIDGGKGIQDVVKNAWLKKAGNVIAVSNAVRKKSWPPAVVIGNPYRDELFKVLPGVEQDREFVFLGRLVSDKGADYAIKALKEIIEKNTTAYSSSLPTLSIIGDGTEMQSLKVLVSKLGIKEQVFFEGSLSGEALVQCLNRHKYILIPSLWEEPFGNVALEGMACGCIPFVSNGGGLPDAVGNAGIVFERGNLNALVAEILSVIENQQLQHQLKEKARLHLANHLPAVVARRYLDVIEEAAAK